MALRRLYQRVRRLGRVDYAATLLAATNNAFLVHAWTGNDNWGDALNLRLVHDISGKAAYPYQVAFNVLHRPIYSVIGSVLDGSSLRNHIVWGAGFMHANSEFRIRPKRVCAVRGPLTRAACLRQGITCPPVYGDPALLFPRYYRPKVEATHELGIVPHFADQGHPWLRKIEQEEHVRVIDVLGGIEAFVDALLSCRAVASSSLHGVIAADAYGIPSSWIQLSGAVLGDGFKFRDYFAAIGRDTTEPLIVTAETSAGEILDTLWPGPPTIDLDALLGTCPFLRVDDGGVDP